MVRPVESHERLAGREYSGRVRRVEQTPEVHPRDFAYTIHEAEDEPHERKQSSQPFGEDKYESGESKQDGPTGEDDTPTPKRSDKNEDGSLDITA